MKIRMLPSSPDTDHLQHLFSFVIDGRLAVDAGCLGFNGTPRDQAAIDHVVLTHSHADHVCSLPAFVMNVVDATGRGVTVHATRAVLDTLQQDVFNWRIWPDFTALKENGQPLLTLEAIEPGRPFGLGGYTLTAVPLNHPVPTVAYVVDDGRSAVLIAVDTGSTNDVWDVACREPRLAAAFVDAAFPNRLSALALASGHLTPRLLQSQLGRLPERVARIAVHLKPAFHDEIVAEILEARIPNLTVGQSGHDYII